jgi:hypothetical protein
MDDELESGADATKLRRLLLYPLSYGAEVP